MQNVLGHCATGGVSPSAQHEQRSLLFAIVVITGAPIEFSLGMCEDDGIVVMMTTGRQWHWDGPIPHHIGQAIKRRYR